MSLAKPNDLGHPASSAWRSICGVWKRTTSHNDAKHRFGDVADKIFYYSKSDDFTFSTQYGSYDDQYLKDKYVHKDEAGRIYRLSDLRSPQLRPNLTYDYRGYKPHPNGWAISIEKMRELDAAGRLQFPRSPDGRIQLKRYLEYAPAPPFNSGRPETARGDILEIVRANLNSSRAERDAAVSRAATRAEAF